jgi:hypothetical protein
LTALIVAVTSGLKLLASPLMIAKTLNLVIWILLVLKLTVEHDG